ncbi:MAG: DUF5667 domain-containing protein [Ardenticatenales bacterium]
MTERMAGGSPAAGGQGQPPDEGSRPERFARAWDEVADGASFADVVASLADDAELAALLRLAAAASLRLPAAIATPTRDRQRAALIALCQQEGDVAGAVSDVASRAVSPRAVSPRAVSPRTVPPRTVPHRTVPPRRADRERQGVALGRWRIGGWPSATLRVAALRLVAAVLAVTLGLGSAVVASANDVPGDALYPVKRAAESARVALTFDAGRRAAYHLELATLRISELRALINRGRNPSAGVVEALIDQLWAAEADATAAADGLLLRQARDARAAAAIDLRDLADGLPPGPASVLVAAAGGLSPHAPPPETPARPKSSEPSPNAAHAAAATASPSATAGAPGSDRARSADDHPAGVATGTAAALATAAAVVNTAPTVTPLGTPPGTPPGAPDPGDAPPAEHPSQPGAPATTAPQPASTSAPAEPPADAPTADNPIRDARATDLAKRPPKPTRTPKPNKGR